MPSHDFKTIPKVLNSKELVDFVLSKTQRQTPTVIHKANALADQRLFYVRKVKALQQNITDKLDAILKEFPIMNKLHSFYKEWIDSLFNIQYLSSIFNQVNKIKTLCHKIVLNDVKLIKYAQSQFHCKQLKRQAFGKIVKLLRSKNMREGLEYLENVRQQLQRMPCIDTSMKTVILAGYPNVGKSSFINQVSRACVAVESYAFTTKSLYVGHSEYESTRWQFIDTPGLLDRSTVEMSVAEKVALNAVLNLETSGVLYLIDISETCGYTIAQQVQLYKNIRELYRDKPLIIGLNKVDIKPYEGLTEEDKKAIESIRNADESVSFVEMSTLEHIGISEAHNSICAKVLQMSNQMKVQKVPTETLKLRLLQEQSTQQCNKIPEDVLQRIEKKLKGELNVGKTRKELVAEDPQYQFDPRDQWDLRNPDDRHDVIPIFYNGYNYSDFRTVDFDALLEKQRKLEDTTVEINGQLQQLDVNPDTRDLFNKIRERSQLLALENREKKNITGRRTIQRHDKTIAVDSIVKGMDERGLDISRNAPGITRSLTRTRSRSESRPAARISELRKESIARTDASRGRSRSGLRDQSAFEKVEKIRKKAHKSINKVGKLNRQGESDRHIGTKMPKHLFSGKRGMGKNERR